MENVLLTHPDVVECSVTGVSDEQRGQVVKATIVLDSKRKPNNSFITELKNYVKKATASYKVPRIIEFVDHLPKNTKWENTTYVIKRTFSSVFSILLDKKHRFQKKIHISAKKK